MFRSFGRMMSGVSKRNKGRSAADDDVSDMPREASTPNVEVNDYDANNKLNAVSSSADVGTRPMGVR